MSCNLKTMLKVLVALLLVAAAAYALLPQFRPLVLGALPFAFFLICPISMLLGMSLMGKQPGDGQPEKLKENHG